MPPTSTFRPCAFCWRRVRLDIFARLPLDVTQDRIASDLGIRLPTLKTLHNRAFARLGIYFHNELFARVMPH